MSGREPLAWVEAYHDGELGVARRLWAAWRLRRDPRARAELAALRALRGALRALDADAETPDLWPALDARLPERGRGVLWVPAPWAATGAALAAAAAVALVVWSGAPGEAPRRAYAGAVRWLDAHDRPMMVLRDDAEATIIWVPDPAKDRAAAGRETHGRA